MSSKFDLFLRLADAVPVPTLVLGIMITVLSIGLNALSCSAAFFLGWKLLRLITPTIPEISVDVGFGIGMLGGTILGMVSVGTVWIPAAFTRVPSLLWFAVWGTAWKVAEVAVGYRIFYQHYVELAVYITIRDAAAMAALGGVIVSVAQGVAIMIVMGVLFDIAARRMLKQKKWEV